MKLKERRLTEAESKRKVIYEQICTKMKEQGYQQQDLLIDVVKANLGAIAILPLALIPVALYWRHYSFDLSQLFNQDQPWKLILYALATLLLVVIHELIHGFVWGLFAPGHYKDISFGVVWKMLTPYCSCAAPMKKWRYILGAAMPTLVLGIGLTAAALYSGSFLVLLLDVALILGGGGDFLIIWKILRHPTRSKEAVYLDHPYECGVVTFEK